MSDTPSANSRGVEHVGTVRRRRFIYAVATSGLSKVLALGAQLLALPLALHSLGTDRYSSFLALQSLLSWTGLFGFGLSYALPKYISAAFVAGDHREERNLVGSAVVLMSGASLFLLVVLGLLGMVISPTKLVAAAGSISPAELTAAYFATIAINTLQLATSIDPTIRSGYQEFHRSSVASIISWILVFAGLLYIALHSVTISIFLLLFYGPITLTLLIDLVLLFWERPYLRRGGVDLKATVAKIARPSGSAVMYQAQFALAMYLPVLIMAHLTDPMQTAVFGSVLQLVVIGVSSLSLILQPLAAAMANAHSHNDARWVRRNHRKTFWLFIGLSAVGTILATTIGPFVIHQWLGHALRVTPALLAGFSACMTCVALLQLEFFSLSAMGALRRSGFVPLLAGAAGLALGSLLCIKFGSLGMLAGVTAGLAVSTAFMFVGVQREIASMEHAAQTASTS